MANYCLGVKAGDLFFKNHTNWGKYKVLTLSCLPVCSAEQDREGGRHVDEVTGTRPSVTRANTVITLANIQ